MGIKVTHTLLTVLVSVVLARVLGAEGYGVYAFVYALVNLLALPATAGMPQLVVRETAKAHEEAEWGRMRGLWRWSSLIALAFSLTVAAIAAMILVVSEEDLSTPRSATLAVGLAMVPLMALARLRDGAMRGLGRVLLGQLSENIVRPALLVGFTLAALVWLARPLRPADAMALHLVAVGAAFVLGVFLLYRVRPEPVTARPAPVYQWRTWLVAALPLAASRGANLINQYADILLLGIFRTDAEVGVYRVVLQGSILVAFSLQAINMVVQPHFARLYAQGDLARLQHLVTQSARGILVFALLVLLLYVFVGQEILGWVFGEDYRSGYGALVILGVGQLIKAAAGPVGALLNMTGHERDTMRVFLVGAALNVGLNLVLIPEFGIVGAAWATSISFVVWSVLLYWMTRRRLGINSTAIKGNGLK